MSEGELISELARAQELAAEWDGLSVAASRPVTAPAWVLPWWRHVAPAGAEPRLVAVRDRGALVGVAPFYALRTPGGIVEYRLMAGDFGVCMEPLALPGREWEVAAEIARVLARTDPRPDVLAFGPMALASHWTTALGASWEGPMPALVRRYRREGAPMIILREPSYEAWFASLSSKMRHALRRSERLFQEAGGTARWTTSETLDADARIFERLHRQRWEGRGWSRLSDLGESLPEWLAEVARDLIDQGRFGMCILEVEGTPICADFHLAAGEELSAINAGWDESYARLSPAKLAVLRVVARAHERGMRRVSLGNGDAANKLRLANANDPVAWTLVMPPSLRLPRTYGRALPTLLKAHGRELAERLMPEERLVQARTALQRLRG